MKQLLFHRLWLLLLPAITLLIAPASDAAPLRAVTADTVIRQRDTAWLPAPQFGLEVGIGRGTVHTTAAQLPDAVALAGCDHFSDGQSQLLDLRLSRTFPLSSAPETAIIGPPLALEAGLSGSIRALDFHWTQQATGYNNGLVPFTIDHQLTARLSSVGLDLMGHATLAPAFTLDAGLSVNALLRETFERTQHLGAGQHDTNGAQDERLASGTLSSGGLHGLATIDAGLSYGLPLSHRLFARPFARFRYPIGGLTPYWSGPEITAGLALLFGAPREMHDRIIEEQRRIDTLPPPPPVKTAPPPIVIDTAIVPELTASIRAVAVSRTGDTSGVVRMMIEEVRTRSAYPVLNYIFFDEGSASLPARYVRYQTPDEASRSFKGSEERSDISLMALYRETLNIFGDRLRRAPRSTSITLIGSTSNTGRERDNLALARARAETVKQYLVSVWQIDPRRIRVEARAVPDRPSPLATLEGQAENRRVEIRLDDDHLSEPITVTNIEHLATPDRITLKPQIRTHAPITQTFTMISAGGTELQSFRTTGKGSSAEKLWAPTEATLASLRDSLDISYDVWDSAGHHAHATSGIPLDVTRIQHDRAERIERFSLILFGFDDARLGRRNEREVRRAAELIPTVPVERVLIQGFTDESGDASHNDELSRARAEAVRRRLEELLHRANAVLPQDAHTEGRGSRDLLYDNTLPEGRFFSRTVNITIQRATH